MKCWLSLDDLARNCQGFGLTIAAKITGKGFGRRLGDVNVVTSPILLETLWLSSLIIALQQQWLSVDLRVVVGYPAHAE